MEPVHLKVNTARIERKVLWIAFSFLLSLTIGSTQVTAHPAVVAFTAAHVVAAHVVATHVVAAHAATAVGAHAAVAHGIAGHMTAAGAAQAGMGARGAAMAGQTVFAHGMVMHGMVAPIAGHISSHGSMLAFAHGARFAPTGFSHVGSNFAGMGVAHLANHGSMLAYTHGAMLRGGASVNIGAHGSPFGPTGTFTNSFPTQIGQQGFGAFSIHSQRAAQNYIGSAYYTRFRTYQPKSLTGISQYYGQYSPYPGASTYGTFNSGDLFMGKGGYLPSVGYSPSSVGTFSTGYGGFSTSPGITSSYTGGLLPGYAGYGAPGYSRLATGFGGNGIYPNSAAYARYLQNPGYPVYTGQAGSSIYPSLGATAYSPGVQYSSIYPGYGLYTGQAGSPVYTAINTGGLPNNYISQAAQIRLFPTATNNYGYANTVFSSNSFIAEQQVNPFAGAYAAALPNTASGNFVNSFTGIGLYNSL